MRKDYANSLDKLSAEINGTAKCYRCRSLIQAKQTSSSKRAVNLCKLDESKGGLVVFP